MLILEFSALSIQNFISNKNIANETMVHSVLGYRVERGTRREGERGRGTGTERGGRGEGKPVDTVARGRT